mmetsp:Transcript_17859/g.28153  ORF Transcript_17859/g.28153 Transcript_17859/m.28153 type:complete len:125 (-) Transcript_17859:1161-1535(-)
MLCTIIMKNHSKQHMLNNNNMDGQIIIIMYSNNVLLKMMSPVPKPLCTLILVSRSYKLYHCSARLYHSSFTVLLLLLLLLILHGRWYWLCNQCLLLLMLFLSSFVLCNHTCYNAAPQKNTHHPK